MFAARDFCEFFLVDSISSLCLFLFDAAEYARGAKAVNLDCNQPGLQLLIERMLGILARCGS